MKDLSKEKIKVLAERNGWSLAHAEGFVEGETYRRRGKIPSTYARIGIDEYCLGFRAGYYERQNRSAIANMRGARMPGQRVNDSVESLDITPVSQSG